MKFIQTLALILLTDSAHGKKEVLSACMDTYPGYIGDIDASGSKVIIKFDKKGMMEFKYSLNGVEADCTDCGIHIHAGTTCTDPVLVGGLYWDATKGENPWTVAGGAVYNSDAKGKAKGSFDITNGYDAAGNVDHAVSIHAQDGSIRFACGVLSNSMMAAKTCPKKKKKMSLETCIDVYPGYTGDINVVGKVKVAFDGTDQNFQFKMKGADVDCLPDTCGIHIHTGTTCADETLVGGHYWDATDDAPDPWTPAGGAVYESNSKGKSMGAFDINSGYDYSENVGHAVVVHDKNGVRYGCGVLSSEKVKSCL